MLIFFIGIVYYNYEVCNKYFICKGEIQMRKTNEILIRNYYDDEEDLVLVEHKILKFHLRGKLYNRYN